MLALAPGAWLRRLGLPVVSYAMPALIAVGLAIEHHRGWRGPRGWVTRPAAERLLRRLAEIQPRGGGFLEAAPLTSFVVMCLASMGRMSHPVAARGVEFLRRGVRADGSWPIDTDLAMWVTTLAVNAISKSAGVSAVTARGGPPADDSWQATRQWLLAGQLKSEHPYTGAAAGGWAWSDLSGAVPDADDTAGAMLALSKLCPADVTALPAARAGAGWLLDLQNSDGGIPTFCRGWGKLPFDRSTADLTAHALAAWCAWSARLEGSLGGRVRRGCTRAVRYLTHSQRADGSWCPLWFGNQYAPGGENLTYGTARVVSVLAAARETLAAEDAARVGAMVDRGAAWLTAAQNEDGSWGPAGGVAGSIEETALAVEALAAAIGGKVTLSREFCFGPGGAASG